MFCRHASWHSGDIPCDSSLQASDDVLSHPIKRHPSRLQEVHARCNYCTATSSVTATARLTTAAGHSSPLFALCLYLMLLVTPTCVYPSMWHHPVSAVLVDPVTWRMCLWLPVVSNVEPRWNFCCRFLRNCSQEYLVIYFCLFISRSVLLVHMYCHHRYFVPSWKSVWSIGLYMMMSLGQLSGTLSVLYHCWLGALTAYHSICSSSTRVHIYCHRCYFVRSCTLVWLRCIPTYPTSLLFISLLSHHSLRRHFMWNHPFFFTFLFRLSFYRSCLSSLVVCRLSSDWLSLVVCRYDCSVCFDISLPSDSLIDYFFFLSLCLATVTTLLNTRSVGDNSFTCCCCCCFCTHPFVDGCAICTFSCGGRQSSQSV